MEDEVTRWYDYEIATLNSVPPPDGRVPGMSITWAEVRMDITERLMVEKSLYQAWLLQNRPRPLMGEWG